eukprot:TRINITY_DN67654_c8_g8_i1.p1 TRINITY_DN67654_c8_g8~~TRINITY_DN67654_c8_g8_i1.p1  ORF type:complete len:172 (+),score=20.30 TRINITY_DN67654_c8_g8_i1:69-518(+)
MKELERAAFGGDEQKVVEHKAKDQISNMINAARNQRQMAILGVKEPNQLDPAYRRGSTSNRNYEQRSVSPGYSDPLLAAANKPKKRLKSERDTYNYEENESEEEMNYQDQPASMGLNVDMSTLRGGSRFAQKRGLIRSTSNTSGYNGYQ